MKWLQLNCFDSAETISGSGNASANHIIRDRLGFEYPRPYSLVNCFDSAETGLEVVVGLKVVEDFGWAVPFFDFDVEVREVAWFVVEMVAVLGFVGGMNPDDSVGGCVFRDGGRSLLRGCRPALACEDRSASGIVSLCRLFQDLVPHSFR